jgi:hypothetical protein
MGEADVDGLAAGGSGWGRCRLEGVEVDLSSAAAGKEVGGVEYEGFCFVYHGFDVRFKLSDILELLP